MEKRYLLGSVNRHFPKSLCPSVPRWNITVQFTLSIFPIIILLASLATPRGRTVGNLHIQFRNFINVRHQHPIVMFQQWTILVFIVDQEIQQNDPIIWVETSEVCESKFMYHNLRTSRSLEFYVCETTCLKSANYLHSSDLLRNPCLILRPCMLNIELHQCFVDFQIWWSCVHGWLKEAKEKGFCSHRHVKLWIHNVFYVEGDNKFKLMNVLTFNCFIRNPLHGLF